MQTKLDWQPYNAVDLSPPWRYWLGVQGSLTKALEEKGDRSCVVTVHREGYDQPLLEECELLSLEEGSLHWVREVTLSQDVPLVNARSVFPRELISSFPEFSQLGAAALGRLLFSNDPAIYRGEIQVTKLSNDLWARRSPFHVKEYTVLVCEVFLDAVASL